MACVCFAMAAPMHHCIGPAATVMTWGAALMTSIAARMIP